MKRNILLSLLVLILAVELVGCSGDRSSEGSAVTTTPSTPTSKPTALTTEPTAPTTEPTAPTTEPIEPTLPEYVPGSIKLMEDWMFPRNRKYRQIYYKIDYRFHLLLTREQRDDWNDFTKEYGKATNYGEYAEEMYLVTMIKRYNIPREACQKVVDELYKWAEERRYDLTREDNEIVNLDIIYTFDNEIINHYYRYE